jgi:hypothetical protein
MSTVAPGPVRNICFAITQLPEAAGSTRPKLHKALHVDHLSDQTTLIRKLRFTLTLEEKNRRDRDA